MNMKYRLTGGFPGVYPDIEAGNGPISLCDLRPLKV